MKKQISLKESVGKILTNYEFVFGQLLLIFENEFVFLKPIHGYECGDDEIIEYKLEMLDFGDHLLIRHQILSKEELENLKKEKDRLRLQRLEEEERLQYEKLKKKYDNTNKSKTP